MKREFDLRPLRGLQIETILAVAVCYKPHSTLFIIDSIIEAALHVYYLVEYGHGWHDNHLFQVPVVVR